jgi:hypothetical protein
MYLQTLIIGTSSKDTWHNTRDSDLTYFSRSQRSKFKILHWLARFVTIWPRMFVCIYTKFWPNRTPNMAARCILYSLHLYQILTQSDSKYDHKMAILENRLLHLQCIFITTLPAWTINSRSHTWAHGPWTISFVIHCLITCTLYTYHRKNRFNLRPLPLSTW